MKKSAIILAALAVACSLTASAKSFKRGVSENQFSIAGQMSPLEPGVSWYYNWSKTPGAGYQNQVIDFEGFEFVPMAWNGIDANAVRTYCASHPNVKYILGYNEPNFTNQANMTPQQAANKWHEVTDLAAELGLQVVAPALNYSTGTYAQPTKWMDEFVALVGPDAFDYTALHCYGGLGVMKDMAQTFYERYGKPVWMTEWCFWPGGAGDVYVAPTAQLASMIECVEWLEKTPYIYRYAWFKAIGPTDSANKPNYGLELSANGVGVRELSQQGWTYTYMTDFNPDVWNEVGKIVAATEYISSHSILIDKGENPSCPKPIEISQFNAGAWADYQFDVPTDGTYYFIAEVSGVGEPSRFDPSLAVCVLNADGTPAYSTEPMKFTLPGVNDRYIKVSFEVELSAGHNTLRLLDTNAYQPSGIRISTVGLNYEPGVGISAVSSDACPAVDVYSMQGILLRKGVDSASATYGLPAGIYLINNQKILIK